jgi:uncharacterized protein YbbC (DUF1343 family)
MLRMKLGSDVLLASTRLRGMRVGVVANPASIDQDFTHIVDRVAKTEGVTLGAILRALSTASMPTCRTT